MAKNRYISYESKLDPKRKIVYRIPKSPKWYETLDFVKLRNKWYHKLYKAGFRDIEDFIPHFIQDAPHLKTNQITLRKRAIGYIRRNQFEYFDLARDFLNHSKFQTFGHKKQYKAAVARRVWKLHCDGLINKDIAARLKLTPQAVYKYISKTREDMKKYGELERAIWNAYTPEKTWRQIKKETGASKKQIMEVLEEIKEIREQYFAKISEAAVEVLGLSTTPDDFDESGRVEQTRLQGDWID